LAGVNPPRMNPKRLILAILVAFVTIFLTDFVIHGFWMAPVYKATASLWRPEAEMRSYFGWLMAGQFVAATAFVVLWAKGSAERATLKCAVMFGLFMGLFSQANTLITYAVQPFTLEIVWKWFVAALLQGAIVGIVTFFVYKPAPPVAATP
jgi:hypothetical protein